MFRAMVSQTRNKIAGALAIGAIFVIMAHLIAAAGPAWSATPADRSVKYPQWYTGINEMNAAAKAGKYKDALAIAMRLSATPGIPPQKALEFHAGVVQYALIVKDYATAAAMVDRMLAVDEGYRAGVLKTCVFLAVLQNRMARAQECTALFVALRDAKRAN